MNAVIPRGLQRLKRGSPLQSTTLRDFTGGLNVVDNDLSLDPKYATVLENMFLSDGGRRATRFGTEFFTSILDFRWAVPTGWTQITPAGGHVTNSVGGSVNNSTAWYDGGKDQPLNLGTYMTNTASNTQELIMLGVFGNGQPYPNLVQVYPGTDGYKTGAGENNEVELKITIKYWAENDAGDEVVIRRVVDLRNDKPIVAGVHRRFESVAWIEVRMISILDEGASDSSFGCVEVEYWQRDVPVADDNEALTGFEIVEEVYYRESIVQFLRNGNIMAILGDGTQSEIWSAAIASGKGLDPWSPHTFVTTTVFDGKLLCANGIDKPLSIDGTEVNYLVDEASGSNANVPIGRYIMTAFEYVLIAGQPLDEQKVSISSRGTDGTFVGDQDPNDAVDIDLGKIISTRDSVITGMSQYREYVIVTFNDGVAIGKLGIYDEDLNHAPDFSQDVIEHYGSHSHRALHSVEGDLYVTDHTGVSSLSRSIFASIDPKRVSELINPLVTRAIKGLNRRYLEDYVWSLYDESLNQFLLFVPNGDASTEHRLEHNPLYILENDSDEIYVTQIGHTMRPGYVFTLKDVMPFNTLDPTLLNDKPQVVKRVVDANHFVFSLAGFTSNTDDPANTDIGGGNNARMVIANTETTVFVLTIEKENKRFTWSTYHGWNFRCGTVSALGTVFLSNDYDTFLMGSRSYPIYGDFIRTGYEQDVMFVCEFPWADLDRRTEIKSTRMIAFDSSGRSEFTVFTFTDSFYRGPSGVFWPSTVISFEAGSTGGYGAGPQPFGGGRVTSNERLVAMTSRGKIFKFRIEGQSSTDEHMDLVSLSLLYLRGSIRT